jgi:hypothetical protein
MTADAAPTSAGIDALIEEVRFATDSLAEGDGFEPDSIFRDRSGTRDAPTSANLTS